MYIKPFQCKFIEFSISVVAYKKLKNMPYNEQTIILKCTLYTYACFTLFVGFC